MIAQGKGCSELAPVPILHSGSVFMENVVWVHPPPNLSVLLFPVSRMAPFKQLRSR